MEEQGSSNQFRFLIAAVLSMVVLFGWSYFFTPTKPAGNTNSAAETNTASTPAPQATAAPQPVATAPETAAVIPDSAPNRSITIKSPLYEVTLDSKGAVATSWILLKNKSNGHEFPVYADGSNSANEKPLQLISQKAL